MNEPGASVVHHPAETELFADTLTCDVALPAGFEAGSSVVHPGAAEMLLRSVALVEDSRSTEDNDERGESSLQAQRLEARMDLVLVLLGRLLRQSDTTALPLRPLRWSRRGLRMELGQRTGSAPGTQGIVRLQPADWLPDHIELPVQVLAEAASGNGGHYLWLRLNDPGTALEMALERHLFRLHRRQIANSRRT
ncbi:PilZ domain-containing protein [Stenotrophomonas sp. NLF4-10]|uniref:PilZ domain-containing protein n=1 Tax=Stenotrophomonas sp. NLF4-10 TaxID=2918754 RepID=UPI001EFBCF74|nr:PilZ domain-containing protein [Stenotrophomonas sp. NLF4-10]MCG8276544.1 PilZ domain-containing protein [Stenotrophomonas sp. NLF4-10]